MHDILFRQTAERYAASWAHRQPPWYFLEVMATLWLPALLALPWALPASRRRLRRRDARFLLQVDHSPYRGQAHAAAMSDEDDALMAQVAEPDLMALLLPLPLEVLYDLALGPAVRLAASGEELGADQLAEVAAACWRAVTRG